MNAPSKPRKAQAEEVSGYGVEVPAGQWYLGLRIDEEGEFHLMVMEAAAVRAQKADASATGMFLAKINAPLQHSRTDTQVDKLTILLNTEGKRTGESDLVLTWGKHKMTAPVVADLGTGEKPKPSPPIR